MTTDAALVQGTDEWRRARAGSLGAASLGMALKRLKKGGWSTEREKLMSALIAERLTGVPSDCYRTPAMQWGIDKEPEAREAYERHKGWNVQQIGLVRHPLIEGAHASPDGLVRDHGLVEIKCPNTTTHISTLASGAPPDEYLDQMQWQMACTNRNWCDYVSFDPRVSIAIQLFVSRVLRDDHRIMQLENDVREFIMEMEDKIAALADTYGDVTPPPYVDPMTTGFEVIDV